MIVGITGKIGCGKSTVGKYLKRHGFPVIDADKVCHELYLTDKKLKKQIVHNLGKDILDRNGFIDRSKLAEKVFANRSLLQKLNQLTHKKISQAISKKLLELKHSKLIFIEAFDFENKYFIKLIDKSILVKSPTSQIKKRLINISPSKLSKILATQKTSLKTDYMLLNNGTKRKLHLQLKKLIKLLSSEAKID